jgi:endo-1,4-beta-mannosidase
MKDEELSLRRLGRRLAKSINGTFGIYVHGSWVRCSITFGQYGRLVFEGQGFANCEEDMVKTWNLWKDTETGKRLIKNDGTQQDNMKSLAQLSAAIKEMVIAGYSSKEIREHVELAMKAHGVGR